MSGFAQQGTDTGLARLGELNQRAEAAAATSSTRSAEIASQAITYALSLKESGDPAINLRGVSQQEIRAYLILGDAFRAENNDRKAARYYRQGFTLAQAIDDPVNMELAEAKLSSIGKNAEDLNSRLSKFGQAIVDDLEKMVEEGQMDEDIKSTAEEATLSVMEWQARQAQKRGEYAKAIQYYQQTLPYYLSAQDSMTYRRTCAEIATLYLRLGNESEANRYRTLAKVAVDRQEPSPAPNAIEDLKEIVKQSEAQDREYAAVEAKTKQERQNYLNEAEALLRSGNVEESILSLRKASEMQEKLDRVQRQRQLDSASNAHFIENQLQEIELLTQQQELQEQKIKEANSFRTFILLATALILAIAGLLTYLFFTKKRAHKVLSDTFKELNLAHEDLKVTQTKLVEAEKMASLGQLTAGIAHEINNPVNFISGNLHPLREDLKDLLDMLALYEQTVQQQGFEAQFHEAMALRKRIDLDTVREEISELMNGIEEGASRTTEIVQGLRTFARMDGGEPQGFNLHQGLDSTLALLKNQMTNIEVIRDYGDLPELEGFPGRINQVMMNLFTNAVQAMPEGGWLRIKTAVEDDKSVSIAIQDTGKGMSEDIRQRIFEPFFTTKDVGEGTGLGLAISLGIVQQHGGNILIESQPGHGTLVVVRLPIRQAVKSSMS